MILTFTDCGYSDIIIIVPMGTPANFSEVDNRNTTITFSWKPEDLASRLSCYTTSDRLLLFIEDYPNNTAGVTKGNFTPYAQYTCLLSFVSDYNDSRAAAGPAVYANVTAQQPGRCHHNMVKVNITPSSITNISSFWHAMLYISYCGAMRYCMVNK